MRLKSLLHGLVLSSLLPSAAAFAQEGGALYTQYCAICHETGDRAPGRDVLGKMTPEKILDALENGVMKMQAAERSRAQRRILAEYLSGKKLGTVPQTIASSAYCSASKQGTAFTASPGGPGWNGWGAGIGNMRFQPAAQAGLSGKDVPRLKLKWAFGLPSASSGGTQPVIAGGRLYVGDAEGDLFALDAKTGCIHWRTEAEAGIRTAVVIGPRENNGLALYIGDQSGSMYALDAETGKILWKVRLDDHPYAAITAAPQLHNGRLYVPVSSREESQVINQLYPCCTFRGSVHALDAATGKHIWKTILIDEEPKPREKNSVGTMISGPSGVPVWNTPTVDEKRNSLYFATGNNYSPPATPLSDSVVALDLTTGKLKWSHQHTEGDVWNASCIERFRQFHEPAACPDVDAPDYDFAASPILARTGAGNEVLLAGNKSGSVWALDPENGKSLWEKQTGKGSSGGGVLWGMATDGERVYVPNGYVDAKEPSQSGAIYALDIKDGREIWSQENPPCGTRKSCSPARRAAVTVIPGAVFSGTFDGRFLAYDSASGKLLWDFDTAREFPTINGVKGNGGSMSNGGASVVDGMVYVHSGYSHHGGQQPGNVLLAFSPE